MYEIISYMPYNLTSSLARNFFSSRNDLAHRGKHLSKLIFTVQAHVISVSRDLYQ